MWSILRMMARWAYCQRCGYQTSQDSDDNKKWKCEKCGNTLDKHGVVVSE